MARTCVVTGAASGMGKATAEHLQSLGWRVIGADLANADITADLSTHDGRVAMVEAVKALCGDSLDAAVACAGTLLPSPVTVSVNYFGALATLAGLRPLLARGDNPRAAAITSLGATFATDAAIVAACKAGDEAAACQAAEGKDRTIIYTSTKLALAWWCRHQAITAAWAGSGILLNTVAPGMIDTPMVAASLRDPATLAESLKVSPRPLGRHGEAREVAALLAFVVSAENSMMVGQHIFVDSGSDAVLRPNHI